MFILDAQATCGDYALAHVLDLIRYAYQTICILVPIFWWLRLLSRWFLL